MQKLFLTIGLVAIVQLPLFAQNDEPVPAPGDLVLKLETEGGEQHFHLGELIPVKYSYSAKTPGRYIWLSQSGKLVGGRPLEVSCSPSAEGVSTHLESVDAITFGQMLDAPCGGGMGAGSSGACADCDGEQSLTASALSFGVVPLNLYVRFRTPGTYVCTASSADVTATSGDEKVRAALLAKSNPISLTIINDPAWAHSAAIEYGDAYEKLCRGKDVVEHRFLECSEVARRITYLDTTDSLATEVKWFDGRSHGWDNGFWEAIQHSSQPQEALRLMTSRMQEPDFQATASVIEWLAISELRMEVPEAFRSDTPEINHAKAVETLRKYIQLLGGSLSRKDPGVLPESIKSYRTFAEQEYCEQQSLISKEEQKQTLAGLSVEP